VIIHVIFHVSYVPTFIITYWDDEGMSFTTFICRSLYPKKDNASKDKGLWPLIFYVALFLTHSIWEQVPNIGAHLWWTHSTTFGKAMTFVMPPKKSSGLGAALQPLDANQETLRVGVSTPGGPWTDA
jgi:hypothetical protein